MALIGALFFISTLVIGAKSNEFLYGSEFLNAGTPYGPTPLQDCILPPKVVEGNFTGPIGELQNSLNYTLLNTIIDPSFNESNLPDDLYPWMNVRGNIFTPPGMSGKCFNRSVLFYPKTCVPSTENNNCFEYITNLFNSSWFVVGAGVCLGGYPDSGSISLENSIPTPGNVAVTLSNQCGQSNFGPQGNATSSKMATLVDTDGNRYALQSMLVPYTNDTAWEAYLNSAQLPKGWKTEMVTLTEKQAHYPYIIGNNCYIVLALDNLGNQYHMYEYNVPLSESLLTETKCTVMNNPEGVDGLVGFDNSTSPAPAPVSAASAMSIMLAFVCVLLTAAIMV